MAQTKYPVLCLVQSPSQISYRFLFPLKLGLKHLNLYLEDFLRDRTGSTRFPLSRRGRFWGILGEHPEELRGVYAIGPILMALG